MPDRIRILIADDHAIVREGLRALFARKPDLELVGEAANGLEAVSMARRLKPDVIMLDLVMPVKDGIQAMREIRAENPEARILVLTSFSEDDKVYPAIRAGASGFLLKDSSPQELLQAVRDVHAGRSYLHPAITAKLLQQFGQAVPVAPIETLTARERQVLCLVARGQTNQEIGTELGVSERTAGNHVSAILDKLSLTNRTQAALLAIREGLVTQHDVRKT